jgi:hypothetical protein
MITQPPALHRPPIITSLDGDRCAPAALTLGSGMAHLLHLGLAPSSLLERVMAAVPEIESGDLLDAVVKRHPWMSVLTPL